MNKRFGDMTQGELIDYIFELDHKIWYYEKTINKIIDLLNQPTPTYASCIKLLDEMVEIIDPSKELEEGNNGLV